MHAVVTIVQLALQLYAMPEEQSTIPLVSHPGLLPCELGIDVPSTAKVDKKLSYLKAMRSVGSEWLWTQECDRQLLPMK